MKSFYTGKCALQKISKASLVIFLFCAFLVKQAQAQCIPASTTPVSFTSVTTTDETCPQSGSITVNGAAGGGNVYMYEIFDGPITRAIQSQNVFPALKAGTYKIRITGCNGKFKEAQATILNKYRKFQTQTLAFVTTSGLKCGNTNDAMLVIDQNDYFAPGTLADTALLRKPLRYQVSSNSDPYTGFNGVPYNNFPVENNYTTTYIGGAVAIGVKDTIKNLSAGTTYYVRVTDACGVFNTVTRTIPVPDNTTLTYDFQLKDPYDRLTSNNWTVATKGNCIQWGELKILIAGSPVTSLPANNGALPITVTVKRQDDGSIIQQNIIRNSFLNQQGNFDSIPRIPVTVEVKDACGNIKNFTFNTPLPLKAFTLQASNFCGSSPYFYVSPTNAAPSSPIRFKIYDATNTLIVDKMLSVPYQSVVFGPNMGLCCNTESHVNGFGIYHIVMVDDCGRRDSITHNFQSGSGSAPTPTFSFKTYRSGCTSTNLFTQTITQTNKSSTTVTAISLISGPAGVTYPKAIKTYGFTNSSSGGTTNNVSYLDSLVAGTYQLEVRYGCGQSTIVSFTVGAPITPPATTGNFTWTPSSTACIVPTAFFSSGTLKANITSTDYDALTVDYPYIRILQAPTAFMLNNATSRDGSTPTAPLNLGAYNAYTIPATGLDTASMNVYPKTSFTNLWKFSPGTYTFQMYGSCSGAVIANLTFTVDSFKYVLPDLGASAAYVCDNGTDIKLVASPLGGNDPFQYQIKLETDPDAAYSTVQTSNLFTLPAGTAPGTVYSLRVIDSCGNSFVGKVPVNNFTGQFIVFPSNNCTGASARIITGFIPGATYTWTKPDGTTIVTNSNEINVVNFGPTDVGTYSVTINALNGCIVRTASGLITNGCEVGGPLPVKLVSFTAYKNTAGNVDLKWITATETDNKAFEIQRSTDGVNFTTIQTVSSKATGGNSAVTLNYAAVDATASTLQKQILYYRLKQVNINSVYTFSQVNKVYFDKGFYVGTVYPVPFTTFMNIDVMTETRTPVTITLYSGDGKVVTTSTLFATTGANSYQFTPRANLKSGVYVLKIVQGNNVYTQKVNCIK